MFQEIPSLKKKKKKKPKKNNNKKNTGPLRGKKKITNRSGILKTPITLQP